MKRTTILLVIGFVILWNSGFIGAEYGLPYAGPFTMLFWRYLGLTAVIALYLLIRNRLIEIGKVSWQAAGQNMIVGILAHGVWLTCAMLALDSGVPAGIVALVVALQPLAPGALSRAVTGETAYLGQGLGLILGFAGVALTVGFRMDYTNSTSVFGYLVLLGSVAAITLASLIQRRTEIQKSSAKLPVDISLFFQSLATVLALALPAYFVENLQTNWEPKFIYTLSWLILGVSLAAYGLMWLLIERLDATRVASLFYLGPPVTMFMAWIVFGDQIQFMDIVGVLVVFAGVLLIQFSNRKLV